MNLRLIAIGGALGSVTRYLLSSFVRRASGSLLRVGTFAVNVVGCVVFGVIAGLAGARSSRAKIDAFMPDFETMVGDGLMTIERADVLLYRPARQGSQHDTRPPRSALIPDPCSLIVTPP